MFIKVPAVVGITVAELPLITLRASRVIIRKVTTENLEFIFPNLAETVTQYISLHKLRSALNIKTSKYIAIRTDTCRI